MSSNHSWLFSDVIILNVFLLSFFVAHMNVTVAKDRQKKDNHNMSKFNDRNSQMTGESLRGLSRLCHRLSFLGSAQLWSLPFLGLFSFFRAVCPSEYLSSGAARPIFGWGVSPNRGTTFWNQTNKRA